MVVVEKYQNEKYVEKQKEVVNEIYILYLKYSILCPENITKFNSKTFILRIQQGLVK